MGLWLRTDLKTNIFASSGSVVAAFAAIILLTHPAAAQEAPVQAPTEQSPAEQDAPAPEAPAAQAAPPAEEAAPAEKAAPAQDAAPDAAAPAAQAPAAEETAPAEAAPAEAAPESAAPAAEAPADAPVVVAPGGAPTPWQWDFAEAATPIMEQITDFNTFVHIIIVVIALFVLALMIYVIMRFSEKNHPVPSRTTHHTGLEVAWTVVPVLILVIIAIPSFRLLFAQYNFPPADLTIKAIGNQWYWTYEYPDHDNMTFDALMVEDADLKPGQPRLLATDNDVVVPVGKNVHVLVTASDVIHNWAIPAFGVKLDAVPGRVIKTWFRAEKTGTFYGMCSELCGQRHAYMPIAVRVLSEEDFAAWLTTAKEQFARADTPKADVARSEN